MPSFPAAFCAVAIACSSADTLIPLTPCADCFPDNPMIHRGYADA